MHGSGTNRSHVLTRGGASMSRLKSRGAFKAFKRGFHLPRRGWHFCSNHPRHGAVEDSPGVRGRDLFIAERASSKYMTGC